MKSLKYIKTIQYKFFSLVFLIILFPLFPLLPGFFTIQGFYIDWWNHLWMTNYFGIYFDQNSSFPMVINTNNFGGIGNPSPLFYGYLFYPFFGLLSFFLNADLALRTPFFLLWLIQFVAIYKVFIKITGNKNITLTITALSLWTIYPLTNIYNRSAITEAYAAGLLTVSVCYLLLFLQENKRGIFLRYLGILGLSVTLIIGFHPVTALYGSCFLGIIYLIHLIFFSKNSQKILEKNLFLFGTAILSLTITSPLIYAFFQFGENIRISSQPQVNIFSESIDFFLSRFLPFPLDLRSLVYGFKVNGGTPFLETQTNVPLGILWIFLAYYCLKKNSFSSLNRKEKIKFILYKSPPVILSILLFVMTTAMSLSKLPYEYIPSIFENIQFGYRMLTFQNISIIFATYVLFFAYQKNNFNIENTKDKKIFLIISSICLSFSFIACLEKNMHGLAIVGFSKPEIPKNLNESIQLNRQYYGAYKYTVNNISQIGEKKFFDINFKVNMTNEFGISIKPIHFDLSEEQWIKTNIHAFPWNNILVNGSVLKKEFIKQVKSELNTGLLSMNAHHLAFKLTPGQYTVGYEFSPTKTYLVLRNFSLWLSFIWFLFILVSQGLFLFQKIKKTKLN